MDIPLWKFKKEGRLTLKEKRYIASLTDEQVDAIFEEAAKNIAEMEAKYDYEISIGRRNRINVRAIEKGGVRVEVPIKVPVAAG